MKFTKSSAGGTVEILASKDYQAIPIYIAPGSEGMVVKAGMPIREDGAIVEDGQDAIGILLYDVIPDENPNGAAIVSGIVDWTKCQENSGATADADEMKKILPAITFRENISSGLTQIM